MSKVVSEHTVMYYIYLQNCLHFSINLVEIETIEPSKIPKGTGKMHINLLIRHRHFKRHLPRRVSILSGRARRFINSLT
jgi:hypothetical protein